MAPITGHTWTWLKQVREARRPKPETIERIRALLAGEEVPPRRPGRNDGEPRSAPVARATETRNGLSRSEAEVLRRSDAGEPLAKILAETGINQDVAKRALGFASETGSVQMLGDLKAGSSALLEAIRAVAPSISTAPTPRRQSGQIQIVGLGRPIASGRDPCPRCATRGDVGCKHFRPSEAAA